MKEHNINESMTTSGTKLDKKDTSSSSGNYITHVVDADIRPINDKVPFVETYKDLYDSIKKTRVQTKDHSDSLIAQINSKTVENADLKAQIQEKVFEKLGLKNELITPHYLPKVQEYVLAKPHHVIATGSSRNSQEESCGSNDMAHNHYLEEARKKTQERNMNSKPSVTHTTSLQNTTDGSKQKPRSNNQTSRSLLVSKSSGVTSNSVPLCSAVYEKTSPRSCLRWKPTGRIFNTVGLRWVPTRKIFTSSITKVDSEPPNDSNEDITNRYECEQTLNVSECTLNLSACTPFNPKKERLGVWLLKKLMSKNQVPLGIHKQEQSLNSSQVVKEQQQRAYFDDLCHKLLHKVYIS
ncbi:hypothetical protein Tco_0333164 [Tanacetum coccineum]